MKKVFIFSLLGLALVLAGCSLSPWKNQPSQNQNANVPIANENTNQTPSSQKDEVQDLGTVSTAKPTADQQKMTGNLKKYIFNSLGVSFTVFSPAQREPIIVEKEGNKIYVGGKTGQSVEIFSKNSNQTLQQAIENQFLTNYSKTDCFVIKTNHNSSARSYPTSYETAEISYPRPANIGATNDGEPWFANSKKCPTNYSRTNGIRYFLGDQNHPDIFVFFSIGQYAIFGDADYGTWQYTIEFIK